MISSNTTQFFIKSIVVNRKGAIYRENFVEKSGKFQNFNNLDLDIYSSLVIH